MLKKEVVLRTVDQLPDEFHIDEAMEKVWQSRKLDVTPPNEEKDEHKKEEEFYKENELTPKDQYDIETIGDKIKNGKVILFLGAAVHCPPPSGFKRFYKKEGRPPLGRDLAEILERGLPRGSIKYNNHSLSWIAQYYETVKSRNELVAKIADVLNNKKPSPLVYALAEMNFPYIITTNYDNLFEAALIKTGKTKIKKGIYRPNKSTEGAPLPTDDFLFESLSSQEPFIYKIHGDIESTYDLEKRKFNAKDDAIVITDEDYIHFILRMGDKDNLNGKINYNPIPASFTKALADPDEITVLFIGYSLLDYNLRLMFKSALWKKDIAAQLRKWSVDLFPDITVRSIFEKTYTLTFIDKDAWVVIPYLYNYIFNKKMPLNGE